MPEMGDGQLGVGVGLHRPAGRSSDKRQNGRVAGESHGNYCAGDLESSLISLSRDHKSLGL